MIRITRGRDFDSIDLAIDGHAYTLRSSFTILLSLMEEGYELVGALLLYHRLVESSAVRGLAVTILSRGFGPCLRDGVLVG